ncbi:MAG TPA: isoleucine--tRNA ligase [Gemmatimonadales bacterium]|nr:isoleucine--tRNA ligase [Gemmatimonadales bacterium]
MTKSRFPPLDPDTPADQLERELLDRWKAEDLFHEVQRRTANGAPFVFYEGPPTANGRPGIHHVFARTIKDLIPRYHVMRGERVTRIAGWDTHGLPVEIEVEKALGLSGKTDIGDHPGAKISVAEFNRLCRESVWRYKGEWEWLSNRIGYWLDYDRPYITYTPEYIESVWWLLGRLHEKGLLYKGHKVLPYCPRCGTALSSHELALGYDTARDPSVYVLYKLEGTVGTVGTVGTENTYLLVWTTTPWTLAANFAVAVHPELDYVEIEWRGKRVILAESRLSQITAGGDTVPLSHCPTVRRFKGSDLVGLRYRRPLEVVPWPEGRRWEVVAGDFVTAEDGSGLVHMAPFGADDFAVLRAGNFAYTVPVDASGVFRGTTWPEIEGKFVKDADHAIMDRLKKDGLLLKRETVEHSYPFCWRCDTPLLYYPRESWFVRTTAFKDRMVELNAQVDWHPPEMGSGRFGEWLENNVDWALSRDRFWGTPLPVWQCDREPSHVELIDSYAKLAERWGRSLPADFDPHKPWIDGCEWRCGCGGTMRRVPEVIDTWFDSGSMPVAQWHYPFENEDRFRSHFPGDYIAEGVDQTRGWFYSLLAIAVGVFDVAPYRHVIVNGLLLDAQGQKMSKSRGNVADPAEAIRQHGADAVRLYLLLTSQVWLPKRYDPAQIHDVAGNVLEKLRHTYHMFQLYAGSWTPEAQGHGGTQGQLVDRWLLDRLDETVAAVNEAWSAYDVSAGCRAIVQFVVDDLSNWWVRLNRGRFWAPGAEADPAALATLHTALVTTARLLAPAAPFLSDILHRNLTGQSVHLARFPESSGGGDHRLSRAMDIVRRLASLARSAREKAGLRVRQPLSRMLAAIPSNVDREQFAALVPLLVTEVNVKQVELVTRGSDLVSVEARPNFRSLGKRFGKATPQAAEAVRQLSAEQVAKLEAGQPVTIAVQGAEYEVYPEDLVVHRQAKGEMLVESDGEVVAALDPELDQSLKDEGLAREVVSRVQRMRKDAGFRVSDRIHLWVEGGEDLERAVTSHRGYISGETLATVLTWGSPANGGDGIAMQDVDLDGVQARLAVRRV